MSKICAKCTKSVYPLEELKCLDKVWHKGCFKCFECGMTLNMKNYKGYNKNPYCSAHYPKTKATVVADTPELQRVTANTKIQSQVKYHEEFEKKIKGSVIQVSNDPETQRIKQMNSLVSNVEYKGGTKGNLDVRRQSLPPTLGKPARLLQTNNLSHLTDQPSDKVSPFTARSTSHSVAYSAEGGKVDAPRVKRIGSIADYDPVNENYGSLTHGYQPASRQSSQSQEWEETVPLSPSTAATASPQILKDLDHDGEAAETSLAPKKTPEIVEINNHNGGSVSVEGSDMESIPNDELIPVEPHNEIRSEVEDLKEEPVRHVQKEQVVTEEDNVEPEIERGEEEGQIEGQIEGQVEGQIEGQVDSNEEQETTKPLTGITYTAVYDYDAQDEDEVGFVEGDLIIDCELIDEGWMYGMIVRTGDKGMLPSNYVQQADE